MTYGDAVRLLPLIQHFLVRRNRRRFTCLTSALGFSLTLPRDDRILCFRRKKIWFLFLFLDTFDAYRDAVDEQNGVCSAQDAFVHDPARIARNPKTLNSV